MSTVRATASQRDHHEDVLAQRASSETDAFVELYERYLQPVHRYVRAQVPDHATAEDITAQVFLKSFVSASTYRGEGSYRSWIFQIARNTVTTWQMNKGRVDLPVEEVGDVSPLRVEPDTAEIVEETDLVRTTVAELPDAQQEVIELRYWKDLSIDEIARRTRRSSVAVRQLLYRAKRRLRKKLSNAEVGAIAGATSASAIAIYSIARHRKNKS